MFLRVFILFLFIFLNSLSYADVKISGISTNTYSTANGKFFNQVNATTTNIYGGFAGNDCTATAASNTVCDSCASSPNSSCNSRRIYDSLEFEVTLLYTTTEATVPRPALVTSNIDSGNGQTIITHTQPAGNVTPSGSVTIRVRWDQICNFLGSPGNAGCTGAIPNTVKAIRFGVDVDGLNGLNGEGTEYVVLQFSVQDLTLGSTTFCTKGQTLTGACNFQVYPGDKKVYIENVRANSNFPTIDGTTASAIRVYYQKQAVGTIPNQTVPDPVDLPLSGNNPTIDGVKMIGLSENEVGGLENGTPYLFSIGIVDIARNVGLVTTGTVVTENDFSECFDTTGAESQGKNCHFAQPAEVSGLSSEEFDCFITTAAYGSPFKPKVQTFRKFRNQFLNTHILGRKIIQTYYTLSPPIANWMRKHPQSKFFVRIILWPPWVFAKICLDFPFLLFIFLLPLFIFKRKKMKELF